MSILGRNNGIDLISVLSPSPICTKLRVVHGTNIRRETEKYYCTATAISYPLPNPQDTFYSFGSKRRVCA